MKKGVIVAMLVSVLALSTILTACGDSNSDDEYDRDEVTVEEKDGKADEALPNVFGDGDIGGEEPLTIAEIETEQEEETNGIDQEIFKITLYGDVYQLPVSFSEFAANGWELLESSEPTFAAGDSKYQDFTKDGNKVALLMYNPSENAVRVTGCMVGGICLEDSRIDDLSSFSFANGLTLGSTLEEIKSRLGDDTSIDEDVEAYGKKWHEIEYKYSKEHDNRVDFLLYEDGHSKVTVTNKKPVEMVLDSLVSSEAPEYLGLYKDPGTDTTNGVQEEAYITLAGATYCFPCPVSEFTANGWTIKSDLDGVGGSADEQIIIQKGGMHVNLVVKNFDYEKQLLENCAATTIISSDNNVDIDYYGIKMGMDGKEVDNMLGKDAAWEVKGGSGATLYDYYVVRADGKKIFASVMVSDETGKVTRMDIGSSTWVY